MFCIHRLASDSNRFESDANLWIEINEKNPFHFKLTQNEVLFINYI